MANQGYVLLTDNVTEPVIAGWQDFTPTVTLVGGAGNTVPVYSTNDARYSQKCNTVFVNIHLTGDGGAEGAGTGVINIALPVQAGSSINGNGIGVIGLATNGADYFIIHGNIAAGASTISLERWNSIKVLTDFVGNDQDNATRSINLHFWYEID